MSRKLLIFDTETGGLDPSVCGITQVCAGVCTFEDDWSGFEIQEIFSTVVKEIPGRLYTDEAMAIQGRTRSDLKNGIAIGHAFKGVENLAVRHFGKVRAATPYGVNTKFDVDFMGSHANAYKLLMPFNFVYRDICQWFRLLQDLGMHENYKANLDTIAAHYGIDLNRTERHDAEDDVRGMAEAIRHMIGDFKKFGVMWA